MIERLEIKILTDGQQNKAKYFDFLTKWNDHSNEIIQKTSGSTGTPKQIKIEKSKMKNSAEMTGAFFNLKSKQNCLLCMSPDYIGGKMMLIRALQFNLSLVFAPVNSNPIKELDQTIDFAAMVPYQVAQILKENADKLDLIETLIIGGAPISEELGKQLQQSKCKAFATFGMTETISHVALKDLKDPDANFIALPGITFSTDSNNQLIIHAPSLGLEDLETNDVVNLISETEFEWLGRSDFVINSGGIKLHPEVIERKIAPLFNDESFFIFGKKDQELGEQVVLITTLKTDNSHLTDKIKEKVDKYECPKLIYVVETFIYTDSGKVNRSKTIDTLALD